MIIFYYNFKTYSRIRIPLKRGVLDTTLCDKVVSDLWQVCGFPPCSPVSFTNKTDRHDITEILLNVALNPTTLTRQQKINMSTPTLTNNSIHVHSTICTVIK